MGRTLSVRTAGVGVDLPSHGGVSPLKPTGFHPSGPEEGPSGLVRSASGTHIPALGRASEACTLTKSPRLLCHTQALAAPIPTRPVHPWRGAANELSQEGSELRQPFTHLEPSVGMPGRE